MHTLGVRFSATKKKKKLALLPAVWLQFQGHVTKYFPKDAQNQHNVLKPLLGLSITTQGMLITM